MSESGELTGWTPNGRPGHLRSACEASLRRLELDRIDLYQLHTPDPAVRFAESIGEFTAGSTVRVDGHIGHPTMSKNEKGETFVMLEVTGQGAQSSSGGNSKSRLRSAV